MSSAAGSTEQVDDPIAYFLEDLEYHGKSERTRVAYDRVLREFESYLADELPGRTATPEDATRRECLAWIHTLRGSVGESTVATYASYLHRFYAYMTQVGAFDSNPMTLVMEELDESIDTDPSRREVPMPAMRAFVSEITHPLERAVVVTLLKTGMRVGELCNLDLRDLNLSGPVGDSLNVDVRAALDGQPNTVFVAADVLRGDVVNGELRSDSNKRKRDTRVPVDGELRRTLERWLAIRPDPRSPAEPLFVSTSDEWGARLTPEMARGLIERHARRRGWYRTGGGAAENVTPHYFRHFFTTHLRDRTGDRGVVKYLRGDVADDVIETYTHNWGDRVREVYEAHIYSLF